MQTLELKKNCAVCSLPFCTLSALGKLECREHASEFIATAEDGTFYWPCCNQKADTPNVNYFYSTIRLDSAQGCVKCDHKPDLIPYCLRSCSSDPKKTYHYGNPIIRVKKTLVPRIGCKESQCVELNATSVLVYMYDLSYHQKK